MAVVGLLLVLATGWAVLGLASRPSQATPQFTVEANRDRSGNDVKVEELPVGASFEVCRDKCAGMPGCVAYTFVKQSTTVPKPVCRLKDAAPFPHESSCCISGTSKR